MLTLRQVLIFKFRLNMKTYTFDTNNTTNTIKFNCPFCNTTDYNTLYNDIITAGIKKNPYFGDFKTTTYTTTKPAFLYTKKYEPSSNYSITFNEFINLIDEGISKYKEGSKYYLGNTPILLFEDSIQIGDDLYFYSQYSKYEIFDKLNNLFNNKKTTIIYIDGIKITIKQ